VLVGVTPKLRRIAEEVFDLGNPKAFEDFFADYSDRDLQLLIDFHRHNRELNAERLATLQQKLARRSRRRAAG
jgi:hypothetical protein